MFRQSYSKTNKICNPEFLLSFNPNTFFNQKNLFFWTDIPVNLALYWFLRRFLLKNSLFEVLRAKFKEINFWY